MYIIIPPNRYVPKSLKIKYMKRILIWYLKMLHILFERVCINLATGYLPIVRSGKLYLFNKTHGMYHLGWHCARALGSQAWTPLWLDKTVCTARIPTILADNQITEGPYQ